MRSQHFFYTSRFLFLTTRRSPIHPDLPRVHTVTLPSATYGHLVLYRTLRKPLRCCPLPLSQSLCSSERAVACGYVMPRRCKPDPAYTTPRGSRRPSLLQSWHWHRYTHARDYSRELAAKRHVAPAAAVKLAAGHPGLGLTPRDAATLRIPEQLKINSNFRLTAGVCVVHLLRLRCATSPTTSANARRALKPIYAALTVEAAEAAFADFTLAYAPQPRRDRRLERA